jgi:hypothetical protein
MNEQAELTPQLGNDDSVVALMKKFGLPMTRDQYLELAFMGEAVELGAEEEVGIPEQFQEK